MNPSGSSPTKLSREEILAAFAALDQELAGRGVVGEVCVFGGAVMVLAFNARLATKDVDAVFQPATIMRELAARVAAAANLPADWLNDGVKGFLSVRHEVTANGLPQFQHLRLTMPTAEYLLAMKCLASRLCSAAGEADDTSDITFLIRHLGLHSASAVMDVVTDYYPPNQVPVKAKFLVESLFEEGRV